MKRIRAIAGICLILAMVLLSCAPKATPAPAPQAPAPAPASAPVPAAAVPLTPAKPAWEIEWDRTVEAAKKEGGLLVYSGLKPSARDSLYRNLLERYGIKMESISGRTAEMMEKIITERRVGLRFGDAVMVATSSALPVLKPKGLLDKLEPMLLLPEVLDPKAWRTGGLGWLDRDHMVVAGLAYVAVPIIINTSQVRTEELQSYRDLLNPKWKGKITTDDPTTTGSGSTLWSMVGSKIMSWEFVQELVTKQEPVLIRDKRQGVEWVARGKYPIGMAASSEMVAEFQRIGSPIGLIIPKEGAHVTCGNGVVSVLTQAPHPNAAKVFVNWFLSKEGQNVAVTSFGLPSLRLDVSTEGVDPSRILQPRVKYIFTDDEEIINESQAYREKAKQIFAGAMR